MTPWFWNSKHILLNYHLQSFLLPATAPETNISNNMRRHTYQPSTSDMRQARQNTQLAGTVDDISHLANKSQENRPIENMAHQTFLRRELRQQESRRSSQENERQEARSTVTQPVLSPKYSIQSSSEPDCLQDQLFKYQDATYARLSSQLCILSNAHWAHRDLSSTKL